MCSHRLLRPVESSTPAHELRGAEIYRTLIFEHFLFVYLVSESHLQHKRRYLVPHEALKGRQVQLAVRVTQSAPLGQRVQVLQRQPHR